MRPRAAGGQVRSALRPGTLASGRPPPAAQAAESCRLACRAEGPDVHSFLRPAVNVQTGDMDADEGRAAVAAEPGGRGDEMLRSLRSCRLLTTYRQSSPLDVGAFAELLHRVSAMVEDIPEIAELDLNPVFVRQHRAVVADVRVRLTG